MFTQFREVSIIIQCALFPKIYMVPIFFLSHPGPHIYSVVLVASVGLADVHRTLTIKSDLISD